MNEITRSPLCWPDNVARRAPHQRQRPNFQERSLSQATSMLLQEINRLNNRRWDFKDESVIISTNLRLKLDGLPMGNQPEPADSGVAVYFTLVFARNGNRIERPVVRANDKWKRTADNLYAIAYDIELDRAKFRYGSSNIEQSFRGYLAIPEKCGGGAWWELLGVKTTAKAEEIRDAYRALMKKFHPDMPGGSTTSSMKLTEAYEQAMSQFR